MRALWMLHRRLVVTVVIIGCLCASTGLVAAGSHWSAMPMGTARSPDTAGSKPSQDTAGREHSTRRSPTPTMPVSLTAVQKEIDGQLAQAETPASITAAEETSIPAPAVSTAYPLIPAVDRSDPTAFAIAFATELLDTNYATQSRAELLAWADYEEAPNTLPGVPTSVAGKALVLSLADPGLPGGTPSPTPSAAQWASDGQRGEVQSVSALQAEIDPDWTQIISEGWQPRDQRMTIEVVTGTMTVSINGQPVPPQSFSFTLTLGSSARVRGGYGAVAAGDWTLN
jgi:hypothetical protein